MRSSRIDKYFHAIAGSSHSRSVSTQAILLAGKLTVAVCCKPFQFWFMIEQFVHMGCIFIYFFYFSSSVLESSL